MDLPTLHKRLHQLRLESGLSIDEMARRLGISPMTVERVESGPYTLSVATVVDWAAVCGYDVAFEFAANLSPRDEPTGPAGLTAADVLPSHARLPRVPLSPTLHASSTPLAAADRATPLSVDPRVGKPRATPQPVTRARTQPTPTSGTPAPLADEPPVDGARAAREPTELPALMLPTSSPPPAAPEPAAVEPTADPVTGPSTESFGPFRTGVPIGEPPARDPGREPVARKPTAPEAGGWGKSVQLERRSAAYQAPRALDLPPEPTSDEPSAPIGGALPRTAPSAIERVGKPKLTTGATRTAGAVLPRQYAATGNKRRTADASALEDAPSVGRDVAPPAPRPHEEPRAPAPLDALRDAARAKAEAEPAPAKPAKPGMLRGLVAWLSGDEEDEGS